jgi:hypothetical protein
MCHLLAGEQPRADKAVVRIRTAGRTRDEIVRTGAAEVTGFSAPK